MPSRARREAHESLERGGGDCAGRSIARWSSFMHVSVYLEAESPCQFPVFQTTHFGALVRLLFHELLGLQLRRLLRWSSIGAREGFYLLCSLLLGPWIKIQIQFKDLVAITAVVVVVAGISVGE